VHVGSNPRSLDRLAHQICKKVEGRLGKLHLGTRRIGEEAGQLRLFFVDQAPVGWRENEWPEVGRWIIEFERNGEIPVNGFVAAYDMARLRSPGAGIGEHQFLPLQDPRPHFKKPAMSIHAKRVGISV
jgi:hypothetical protein